MDRVQGYFAKKFQLYHIKTAQRFSKAEIVSHKNLRPRVCRKTPPQSISSDNRTALMVLRKETEFELVWKSLEDLNRLPLSNRVNLIKVLKKTSSKSEYNQNQPSALPCRVNRMP
ncbi:hypothetical protein HHI36_017176 [Cryptolaemus montrouzieri]|uniref:Uncharacterized protein n=1 Tax=Cryptolaemus montrouzieri TaxID=559131 RepID=A0ABD2NM39_9CUCU